MTEPNLAHPRPLSRAWMRRAITKATAGPAGITARIKIAWIIFRITERAVDLGSTLLDPTFKISLDLSADELEQLVRRLPPGYHRSEMRTRWREARKQ